MNLINILFRLSKNNVIIKHYNKQRYDEKETIK